MAAGHTRRAEDTAHMTPMEKVQARSEENWAAVRRYLKWYGRVGLILLIVGAYWLGYGKGALEGLLVCHPLPVAGAHGKPH